MDPLAIKKYPDKFLRRRCQPIEKITEKEIRLFADMVFTIKHGYKVCVEKCLEAMEGISGELKL